jgi:YVTN family beta-propeller protein
VSISWQQRGLSGLVAALLLSGLGAGVARASDQLGFVTDEQAGTLTQVDLTTGVLGAPIAVGAQPVAIAITPDGSTAYVADHGSSAVVPIALATGRVGAPIELGDRPNAIAIAPDGRTAYVISASGREWPITLATGRVGNPSLIPANSDAIAVAPGGGLAYVTNVADGTLSPLTLSTSALGQPINLSSATPDAVAITPDGSTAYIASNNAGTITPLNLATGTSGTPIALGPDTQPTSVAITPDGATAYVTDFGTGQVTPVMLSTGTVGPPVTVGPQPSAIALVPASGITPAPAGFPWSESPSGPSDAAGWGTVQSTVTLGDQQLTLKLARAPRPSMPGARACYAAGSTVAFTLGHHVLRNAARLSLRSVTFTLGRQVRHAVRLPVTERIPLRHVGTGEHLLSVRAFFNERVVGARRRQAPPGRDRPALILRLSRTLHLRLAVC